MLKKLLLVAGFVSLGLAAFVWLGLAFGFVLAAFPENAVGVAALGGILLLLLRVVLDRLGNSEDDYYDKKVEK
jgi:membrane protein implicated in regulation of membrane protease activity